MSRNSTLVAVCLIATATGCGSGSSSRSSTAASVNSANVATSASTLSPQGASNAATTSLTITGQGLLQVGSAALVPDVGGASTPLAQWQANSDNAATAVVPAGMTPGDYRLDLTTQAGVLVQVPLRFQVLPPGVSPPSPPTQPAPTITALRPDSGPNDRPQVVTIQGTQFSAGATVQVGTLSATAVTVRSPTEIEATFPAALPAGANQVIVSHGSLASAPTPWTALNALDPDLPGAFLVGTLDAQIPGASGDRPDVRIYYPGLTAGPGTAVDTRAGPCPVVVYSHGFRPPLISFGIGYRNNTFLAAHLASFGYVVLSIDQSPNNNLFDTGQNNSGRDADDTVAALDYLAAANVDPAHPLLGFLDPTRAAFAGHSRGGDGSLMAGSAELAANGTSRLKALVALGPPSIDSQNNNTPLAFGNFTAARTLLIGASADAVAPYAQQQSILAQAGAPSMAIEIAGGNHSLYKDNDTGILGDGTATISLAVQQAICQRYVTAWLNAHVKGLTTAMAPYVMRGAQVTADTRLRTVDTR